MAGGALQQGLEVQAPSLIPEDLKNSIPSPAKGVGVRRPRRSLTLRVDAQEQLEAFRQGHDGTSDGAGQGIAGALGLVVLENSQGHFPGLPFGEQVLAAHHPLKLRELTNHLTDQIVLTEMGRTTGMGDGVLRQLKLLGENVGEPLQAFHPIEKGAQPFGEGHPLELIAAVDAGDRPVGLDKELGIGQSCLQDAFIPASNGVGGVRQAVADAEETRQQALPRVQGQGIGIRVLAVERHVALMGTHDGAQHFRGQGEVVVGDAALDQEGGLDQIRQLLEQLARKVGNRIQGRSTGLHGCANR